MEIRGMQVLGKEITRLFKGSATGDPVKQIVYVKGFEKMTVDTNDGSFIIKVDEILSFLEERMKES